MVQYIDKSALVAEVKDLYEDIDKCIGDLVLAKSKHDQRGISDAHWKMETLMVNIQQALSYILQHLEVKEVDLEKELRDFVVGDIDDYDMELAKYFFELGLKAQKGEDV